MKVELLAPAKDLECAITAINYGADAVYIGANAFGARHNATNSLEEIKRLVDYAHKFYVKVHVTINTILTNEELKEAQKLIYNLYDIGVDAIIVQDMGLLEVDLPPIALHASTQCNNRDFEKVKFFEKTGFQRVILARELSLNKIKEICENTNVEIETFIHGALCVSYSGQCYLSQSIGGRSANRGECGQPCRKKYSLLDDKGNYLIKNKHLLCLKDFNASENIEALINAGVKSFKIEGRLKDKNYIKNVVGFYRKLIDKYAQKTSSGKVFFDFEPNVNKAFNRGFTDYFLNNRNEIFNFNTPKSIGEKVGKIKEVYKNYFTFEGEKLSVQDGLCFFENDELNGFLINKIENDKIFPNKMPNINRGTVLYRNIDIEFNKKLDISKTTRKIKVDFIFTDNKLIATDEDNNEVKINLDDFEEAKNEIKAKQNIIEQLKKTGESDFYVENIELKLIKIPFLPISKINELRRNILELLMKERLNNYKRPISGEIKVIPYYKNEIDYKGNVHNDFAKLFYEKRNVKVKEFSFETKPVKNAELMRTKHCLKYALGKCKSKDKLFLEDEFGKKYELEFDCKNCEMVIKYTC
ncbi:MAG: U32 family peptidase [Candidatus Gastranaerophilales bacterium]|nr:U32 family peptidase [Candidatus Gastranaerophilales bacterium]